jgi:hypothetical protein
MGDNTQFNFTIIVLCENVKAGMRAASQGTTLFEQTFEMGLQYCHPRAKQKTF